MTKEWQTLDDLLRDAWEGRNRKAWHDAKALVRNYGLEGDFNLMGSFVHSPGYGAELISSDNWVEYAQQLAEEVGAIDKNTSWPNNCIDWEKAANELASDYGLETIDGNNYYCRER